MIEVVFYYVEVVIVEELYYSLYQELENVIGRLIEIELSENIFIVVKLEVVEYKKWGIYCVLYKLKYIVVVYLIMYELIYLELIMEVWEIDENQLFFVQNKEVQFFCSCIGVV